MNTPITVIVGGVAVAKGRPRVTRRGVAYTPMKTRKYEAHASLAAQMAMDGRPPITGPARVEVIIDLPTPTPWSLKRRDAALAGQTRPTSQRYTDNYVKATLDAINGIDIDSLVVELAAEKKYARVPKLTNTVTPLPSATAKGRAA
jgi:Holliday junction resolvase RusA-like endonuclease